MDEWSRGQTLEFADYHRLLEVLEEEGDGAGLDFGKGGLDVVAAEAVAGTFGDEAFD